MMLPTVPEHRRLVGFLKLGVFVAIVVVGNLMTRGVIDGLDLNIRPSNEPALHRIIMISMAAYILLMAIPFVPGVEIGLALMMILGPKIVPLVFICTLTSLCLAYLIGRLVPESSIAQFLREVRLERAAKFLAGFEGLTPEQRIVRLTERTPRKWLPWLVRHRYVTLLVAINLPGNMVVGGGGGLAMMAGMSRLFSPFAFVLLVAVAISPIPILLLLFGDAIASWPI
ncbi:hypothetical protein [Marinobacter apostichopi]|uniref:hypothetical protein n=1 Tax=Marinobacter apostichopi TaxID=3035454 RepID=UPI002573E6A1|nr:hypothetical protein [Marinobacter sp. LA51]